MQGIASAFRPWNILDFKVNYSGRLSDLDVPDGYLDSLITGSEMNGVFARCISQGWRSNKFEVRVGAEVSHVR